MMDASAAAPQQCATQDEMPTPHRSEVWFDDGNIIVQAEKTQFRVHRGVLAKQSVVFKDMFRLPQPANELTVDGHPIVHLSDTARDVGYLFAALYDR